MQKLSDKRVTGLTTVGLLMSGVTKVNLGMTQLCSSVPSKPH